LRAVTSALHASNSVAHASSSRSIGAPCAAKMTGIRGVVVEVDMVSYVRAAQPVLSTGQLAAAESRRSAARRCIEEE